MSAPPSCVSQLVVQGYHLRNSSSIHETPHYRSYAPSCLRMKSGPGRCCGVRSFLCLPRFDLALPERSARFLIAFWRIRCHVLLGRRCRSRCSRWVLVFLFLLRFRVRGTRARGVNWWGYRTVAKGSIRRLCPEYRSKHSPASCGCCSSRCFRRFLLPLSKLLLRWVHRRVGCVGCDSCGELRMDLPPFSL